MHSMHSLQLPKDPKTSRMPSHPGAQADNSLGAQCCSVLNHHDRTDTARTYIQVTSICQQARPARTGLLQVGVAGALDYACGTTLQEAGHVPGQDSRLPPSPGGHCASPGCQTSACRVSVGAWPSPKSGMKLHWKSSPLPSLGWASPSWKPHMG